MKQISLLLIIGFTCIAGMKGQQSPVFSQYTLNKFIYNPAAAGMDGFTTINLLAREQWVGMKGTPRTHALSIDSRILGNSYILEKLSIRKKKPKKTRSGNTAWGASFFSDINGPINRTGVNGSYAYHIDLGDAQLSFGLSLVFYQLRINGSDFVFSDDVQDPILPGGKQSVWNTDANFGAYYTAENYYAGYSTLSLFNSAAQFGENNTAEFKTRREHTLLGGYRFYASNRINVEPSVLLKIPEGNRAQLDLNVKGTYDEKYWVGLGIRTGTAMVVFAGLTIDRYYFGYAFDYNFSSVMTNTYGSHEFMVLVRLGDSARRYKWLNSY